MLEKFSQNLVHKEDRGKPLVCNNLASILEKLYLDKINEEKFFTKAY